MASQIISLRLDESLVKKIDKMARKRDLTRSKVVETILRGACVADELDMNQHAGADELRLAKHFLNVDLLQDLQYLGPKTAELTSRELDSVVLFYRDKKGKMPHLVHQFRIGKDGEFNFTAHALSVLGYCAAHLLPKALRLRLSSWTKKMGGKETDIGTALTVYLSKLYEPADVPDDIEAEISEEMNSLEADASGTVAKARKAEAFGRESR